jgi:hypothetical protein
MSIIQTRRITCRHRPLDEAGHLTAWGLTQATFISVVRATLEIVAGDRLPAEELNGMAEAAWEVFVDDMREAGGE